MQFLKLSTSEVVTESDIASSRYPASLPPPDQWTDELLRYWGFAKVTETGRPTVEPWQAIEPGAIEESDGLRTSWTVVELPAAENKAARAAHIANARYNAEVSGIEIGGAPIPTDRHTQTVLTAMYVKAAANAEYTVNNFKAAAGFVSLTAAEIIAIADAVHDHVQACFDRESELLAQLENGELVSGHDF